MSDLPAIHYLKIFRGRIEAADDGRANPMPEVLTRIRKLVRALEEGDLKRAIRLERIGEGVAFIDVCSGATIGSIDRDIL